MDEKNNKKDLLAIAYLFNEEKCDFCQNGHGCNNCYYGQIDDVDCPFASECNFENGSPTMWETTNDNYCRKCGRKLK